MQFEPLPPVPAVTLARQLRKIPLFRFVSIDELFRIATISQQVRYDAGSKVQEQGTHPRYIQVLLEGAFELTDGSTGESQTLEPPAMLGFREVLEGTTTQRPAQASIESIALAMPAEEFRELLSANIDLAQGLFRILLDHDGSEEPAAPPSRVRMTEQPAAPSSDATLKTVDKALVLQSVPVFARTTGEELYALASITQHKSHDTDAVLFSQGHAASIWLLLDGAIELSTSSGESLVALDAGECLGVSETLAGSEWSWNARAAEPGRALVIEHDALFELLSDRLDLLQTIFGAVFLEGKRGITG